VLVNIATQDDAETVTFRAKGFDRAFGARIYTLDLPSELTAHASGSSDLARLCALAADGRLDPQVELECSWRQPAEASTPCSAAASAAKPCSTSTDPGPAAPPGRNSPQKNFARPSPHLRHVRKFLRPSVRLRLDSTARMTFVDIAPADQTAVEARWASYVADSGYDGPLVMAFAFGDSAELADELGLLVLHGPKRATAELVQAFVAQDEPLPRVGDRCLVLGGDGRPLAIVRTTDVRVGPLSSVDDRFAWDEGEGDRTRAWWLDAHTRFFNRQCAAMGLTFSDDIGVVFERFELVWPTIRT
jgi:uncharacterized protein YhfF